MRYRVLIAEDESEIGRALSEMVQKHPRFTVDRVVTDGTSAMERFISGPALDVLLTDIQMPGHDGLELLAFVREHYPQVKCVIISAYSSFEYARTSLHYGAFEYLLKPISMQKIQTLLDSLAQTMDYEQEGNPWSFSAALSKREMGLPSHRGQLFLMAVVLGNYSSSGFPAKRDEAGLTVYISNAGVGTCETIRFCYRNGIHYILFSAPGIAEASLFAKRLHDRMKKDIYRWKALTCIISAPLGESADISVVGAKLTDQINHYSVFLGDQYMNMNDQNITQKQWPYAYQLFVVEEPISASLRSHNQADFEALLRQKLSIVKEQGITSSLLLEYLKYLYIIVSQHLFPVSHGGEDSSAPIPYDWEQRFQNILANAGSWEALYAQCKEMFTNLFTAARAKDSSRGIALQIEQFICENFNERISNQYLARKFGFVPSYISKLFKDYKGISPCDFLVKVRMENAQRMIADMDDLNIGEIAQAVGFTDAGYFTKVFRRVTGRTPTEYKGQR